MRIDFLITELYRMIEAVPESVVEEYVYFLLPNSLEKYNYHLEESFPNYIFEYVNDGLLGGKIYLTNHSIFYQE